MHTNDNDLTGPFKVPQRTLRDDYTDEVLIALNRTAEGWPGLGDNPVWQELYRHVCNASAYDLVPL